MGQLATRHGCSSQPRYYPAMRNDVTFVHTSPLHIATFERLVNAADPTIQVGHVVAEHLLADAQVVGCSDVNLISRVHGTMIGAASGGSTIVACTCSTIGGVAERTPTNRRFKAVRIDRAMADRAVELGQNILIVAALQSTIQPTEELIRESASALKRDVSMRHLVVRDAWAHFLRGEPDRYIDAIVAAVRAAPDKADVVALAQASMAPASEQLHDLGVEVLSSPLLGVTRIVNDLRSQGRRGSVPNRGQNEDICVN